MRSLLYVGLLAVVACYRLFFDLGRGPVRNDERIYVSVVDRMLETGDWIHLERLRDGVLEPYLNKPPLYFWLTAVTRPMLGSGMAAYRFWSALFGLACVLATFQLGRRMHGPEVGLVAGLALATNRAFLDHHGARVACMDSALVLCAVVAFWLAWEMRDRERRIGVWAVIGLVCGVASLFKTLAGVPLLLLIGAYGLLFERGISRRARVLGPIVGLAACLLVFAPWAVTAVVPSRSGVPRSHLARLRGAGDDRLESGEGARRRLLRLVHDALVLAVSSVSAGARVHSSRRVLPRARSQRPISVVRGRRLDGGAVTRPHEVGLVRLPHLSPDRGVDRLAARRRHGA